MWSAQTRCLAKITQCKAELSLPISGLEQEVREPILPISGLVQEVREPILPISGIVQEVREPILPISGVVQEVRKPMLLIIGVVQEIRKLIISAIMATDMSFHFSLTNDFKNHAGAPSTSCLSPARDPLLSPCKNRCRASLCHSNFGVTPSARGSWQLE